MKHLYNDWRATLAECGLIPLTGESDGTNMCRVLYDTTLYGSTMLSKWLGGRVEFAEGSSWNHSSLGNSPEDQPHACVLLSSSTIEDFIIFCYIEKGYKVLKAVDIWIRNNPTMIISAFKDGDPYLPEYDEDRFSEYKIYEATGTAGTRNTHEMSRRRS